tara:strand:+ start:556 stop:969 length:414 start_codon:yes stop_codon:yes gene_type:complete
MLSGGNPTGGSNPVGVGQLLNTIGNFAYAYSGLWEASTTQQTVLKFDTGAYMFKGILQLNGPIDDDAPALINISAAELLLDGQKICIIANGSGDNGPFDVTQEIIVPAFSTVEVKVVSNGNESDRFGSVAITGRIYA